MAKKKKQELDLTPEQLKEMQYQKAVRRMEGADKMLQAGDRVHMYKTAMKMFEELGDYEDSKEQSKQCKKCLPQARRDYREAVYQSGLKMKNQAKCASDYAEAVEEFQKIKREYKDIPAQIAECRQLEEKALKSERARYASKKMLTLAVLAAIVGVVCYLRTPDGYYWRGRLLMGMGNYERAASTLSHSTGYKDADMRQQECNYQRALRCAQEGRYRRAVKILRGRVGDYKDALEKKAAYEMQILQQAEIGETVPYGTDQWIAADQEGQNILLVQKRPVPSETVYQISGKPASWEESDMRAWLNQEFYQNCFSSYEQAAVVQTEVVMEANSVYGTQGGGMTKDHVFLLDEKEAERYRKVLTIPGSRKEWWLRTPGSSVDSTAFVSAEGTVMHYGYAADSKEIAVRPAVWITIQ